MKRLALAAIGIALVVGLLGGSAPLVRAQPVASIALPPPRGAVQLYSGCNNIALSFPDGTDSQTVVDAVTPAGVVEAMWRHDAAQNRFEGFSPAAAQASDLLTVNQWDAVWLCVTGAAPSNTVWLCRPGLADNPCESDLTTTVVSADGSSTTEAAAPATDPPIDCFYIYPTVSGQATTNANLDIEPAEKAVAISQASRFSQVCKVYAPMYRQFTVKAILEGGITPAAVALAYGDVLSAWQDYLAHYNNGRGVVLIGHSQGTIMLTPLIASEIDPNPSVRARLVSALLIGGNVKVAVGQDVGGDFQNTPACRSADQTGCVVAYSSFDQAPPPDSMFGRADTGARAADLAGKNVEVLCVNPASLSGGTGSLEPYFPSTSVPTPWVAYPGLYTAHCESSGGANWLQVDTTNVPGDQRSVVSQTLGPAWGLHHYDVGLALGNLVGLVRQQAAAFTH